MTRLRTRPMMTNEMAFLLSWKIACRIDEYMKLRVVNEVDSEICPQYKGEICILRNVPDHYTNMYITILEVGSASNLLATLRHEPFERLSIPFLLHDWISMLERVWKIWNTPICCKMALQLGSNAVDKSRPAAGRKAIFSHTAFEAGQTWLQCYDATSNLRFLKFRNILRGLKRNTRVCYS